MTTHLRPPVFCIGLVKTGTTSLLRALELMGWPGCNDIGLLQGAWKQFNDGGRDGRPLDSLLPRFRAFAQNPVALQYKSLAAYYPDAKFVLTTRDANEAIASMLIHVAWNRLHPNSKPHMNWRNLNTEADEQLYSRWPVEVEAFFAEQPVPNRLLVMDISAGDDWRKLCPFLNVIEPAENFPHFNHSKGRLADLLSGDFKYRGKED